MEKALGKRAIIISLTIIFGCGAKAMTRIDIMKMAGAR
jgi:hypothetical protein